MALVTEVSLREAYGDAMDLPITRYEVPVGTVVTPARRRPTGSANWSPCTSSRVRTARSSRSCRRWRRPTETGQWVGAAATSGGSPGQTVDEHRLPGAWRRPNWSARAPGHDGRRLCDDPGTVDDCHSFF